MRFIHPCPEKENFENGFDFLLLFPIYYVVLNNDKFWYVKRELKLNER